MPPASRIEKFSIPLGTKAIAPRGLTISSSLKVQ